MPGFDRSTPIGAGPVTGGGRGLCRRAAGVPSLPLYGKRYGCGRGMRLGHGGGGYGTLPAGGFGYAPSNTAEIEMMRSNADAMQRSLEAIQDRIAALEKGGSA